MERGRIIRRSGVSESEGDSGGASGGARPQAIVTDAR